MEKEKTLPQANQLHRISCGDTGDGETRQKPRGKKQPGLSLHLSVRLTGDRFFGWHCALVIYFVYKDRSRYVAYHALQSLFFKP